MYEWTSFTQNNCNAYVLGEQAQVLIDPGHSHLFSHVRLDMARDGLDWQKVELVAVTHSHPDHFEGVENFLDHGAVKIGLHAEEERFLETAGVEFARMLGLATPKYRIDLHLEEGPLAIGDLELEVYHTPGHSPGHVCLYWPARKALFSGDLIFNQGVGRTDFPGGDGELLKASIRRMAELDVELILCGHGPAVKGRRAVEENYRLIERVYFPML
jgi:glyoxylase-like metal-dependent hydrolase (beta-lactamase superfamily II)